MSISVSIVEDEARIRKQLATLIEDAPGFRCAGVYPSAEEALREIPKQPPDVVLMDINLGGMSGIECVRKLRESAPALQILMLTVYDDSELIFKALAAGASGYLLKRLPPPQLLEAIADVVAGGSPMSSAIARKVVQSFQKPGPQAEETVALSPREREVVEALARGDAYKQIADRLGISIPTVRTYIRRIYEKLHVHTRTEAVAKYLRP